MTKQKSIFSKQQLILALVEMILVTLVSVVSFYTVDQPLVAPIIGFVGTLLVINRAFHNFQTESIMQPTEDKVQKIGEIIDTDDKIDHASISELYKTYLGVEEPEFRDLKDNIINSALRDLRNLKIKKETDDLSTGDYYEWLLKRLDEVDKNGSIKAVSRMHNAEWDDSPQEVKFIARNLNAAAVGAPVERVFIMSHATKEAALNLKPVRDHAEGSNTGLMGYFANEELLKKNNNKLLRDAADGFIIINSKVALIDKFDGDGNVRGVVTMDKGTIKQLEKIFSQLKQSSRRLTNASKNKEIPSNPNELPLSPIKEKVTSERTTNS